MITESSDKKKGLSSKDIRLISAMFDKGMEVGAEIDINGNTYILANKLGLEKSGESAIKYSRKIKSKNHIYTNY
jgi:hypothetical protein